MAIICRHHASGNTGPVLMKVAQWAGMVAKQGKAWWTHGVTVSRSQDKVARSPLNLLVAHCSLLLNLLTNPLARHSYPITQTGTNYG